MHRLYINPEDISNKYFKFDDPKIIKYVRNILRLKKGDKIVLFDGAGWEYRAMFNKVTKVELTGEITEEIERVEDWPQLILAQALPKGNKLDDVVRMNTEVGVNSFLLFESDHSVVKISDFRDKKLERLNRITAEASRQSERTYIPEISLPIKFDEVLNIEADHKILLHSREIEGAIDIEVTKSNIKSNESVLVIIGPEGGFSDNELQNAKERGVTVVYLKLPILRTETAGVVATAILLS